ncbi:hypothetical protein PPSIR1_03613 [Plesiocystis pacifica SIR-1]|uniref:Uncharacterized protein n=1 Tax=Plesiocystis pacifica SIR-1 TaxID=391625 RepID=A6G5I2_9BACT|nr:DUF429 domain-containing protein [Plesiocystis pacifica]EDM78925.1 hypothetical protein PPSIR1_03613 [Plesiocystis pacifica SIR-1]
MSLGGGRGKTTAVARLELGPAEPPRDPGLGDAANVSSAAEGVRRSQARARSPEGRLVLAEARARWGQRGGGELDKEQPAEARKGHIEAPFRDNVLMQWFERWLDDDTVVAFDAPLTLPACVRCTLACPGVANCEVPVVRWMSRNAQRLQVRRGRTDPGKPSVTPYTQRATELLLERATLQPREALGQGMGPLAARAAYLRRSLSPQLRLHENLIEVHPRATLIRLFGARREQRSRLGAVDQTFAIRREMLAELVAELAFDRVWPDLVVRNIHVFHAVIAAFSAYFWAREGWRGPEDLLLGNADGPLAEVIDEFGDLWLQDGWIWTPPVRVNPE